MGLAGLFIGLRASCVVCVHSRLAATLLAYPRQDPAVPKTRLEIRWLYEVARTACFFKNKRTFMNKVSGSAAGSRCLNMFQGDFKPAPEGESDFDRVERLYNLPGGPLIGWLEDDANKRGHDFKELAEALGVTMGYMLQLQRGIRRVQDITHEFCAACAAYLGVPTIAVKLVAGVVRTSDFLHPAQTEE